MYLVKIGDVQNINRQRVYLTEKNLQVDGVYRFYDNYKLRDPDLGVVIESQKIEYLSDVEKKTMPVIKRAFFIKNYTPHIIDPIYNVFFDEEKNLTIVKWKDGLITRLYNQDKYFDKEKAIALAYVKRYFGNRGYFNDMIKNHL